MNIQRIDIYSVKLPLAVIFIVARGAVQRRSTSKLSAVASGDSRPRTVPRRPLENEFVPAELAGVRFTDGELLLPAVRIAADQGHEGSPLSARGAALGLRELSNHAEPFS